MRFDKSIIDSHEQKYNFSCIPSAIEMVLKLLGKVPIDYYDLQEEWKNKMDGNFSDFHDSVIKGVTFEQKFNMPRSQNFPIDELFKTINDELESSRFVIISLATESNRWHMSVIVDKHGNDYEAYTKKGKQTSCNKDIKKIVSQMQGTDILIYRP